MIAPILIGTIKTLTLTMLSEKMILKLLIVLMEWAVPRTTNELDDKILILMKEKLEADGIV